MTNREVIRLSMEVVRLDRVASEAALLLAGPFGRTLETVDRELFEQIALGVDRIGAKAEIARNDATDAALAYLESEGWPYLESEGGANEEQ